MSPALARYADGLRATYWFVPTLMTAGAVGLSMLTLAADGRVSDGAWPDWVKAFVYSGGADGARAMLGAIAGSMITVAGTVFSITIAALTLASQQFGPRMLRNFMRDRGNQVTLGTFLSGFLYSLLVLRKIRSGGTEQVPHLSVSVALLFAVAGVTVLIYFIHHMSVQIQAPNLVAAIAGDLRESIDRAFPDGGNPRVENRGARPSLPDDFEERARRVEATVAGYVDTLAHDELCALAVEEDLVIRLCCRQGRFLAPGDLLAQAWPGDRVGDRVTQRIVRCVSTATERSSLQDIEFPIRQLVEVAVRALSPSVNDPFTAATCVDQLSAQLAVLAGRDLGEPWLVDERGSLRVLTDDPLTFDRVIGAAFDQIRQQAGSQVSVYIHLLDGLARLAARTGRDDRLQSVLAEARLVMAAAEENVPEVADRRVVRSRYDALLAERGR